MQLDTEDDNSWIELTTCITRVKGPYIFENKIVPQRLIYKFENNDKIYLFTEKELGKFGREIQFNNDRKNATQNFSKEIVVSQDYFSK